MALQTGVVRDDRYLEHMPGPTHPEHPSRLRAVHRMLDRDFAQGLMPIVPEPATLELLEKVHTTAYIKKVLKTADHRFTSLAPDTPASARTYIAAWLAVGGCLMGLQALAAGQCDVCFALVRPPGHHALADRAGGFCIFNNLGVTARCALGQFGYRRLLIIDWDVHHGNGLQQLFYAEKQVFYFSTHDTLLYPYTGNWDETGSGAGQGYTVNIPLPRACRDEDILHLYRDILTPVVVRYEPDLILIAAGFDAHHEDPIGRTKLTADAFAGLTRLVLDLRSAVKTPPILLALEGGYSLRGLAESVRSVFGVLTATRAGGKTAAPQTDTGARLVDKARRLHAAYGVWSD